MNKKKYIYRNENLEREFIKAKGIIKFLEEEKDIDTKKVLKCPNIEKGSFCVYLKNKNIIKFKKSAIITKEKDGIYYLIEVDSNSYSYSFEGRERICEILNIINYYPKKEDVEEAFENLFKKIKEICYVAEI